MPDRSKTVLRLGLRDGNMIPIEVPSVRLRGDRETIAELEGLVGEGAVRLGGSFGPLPGERRGGRRGGGLQILVHCPGRRVSRDSLTTEAILPIIPDARNEGKVGWGW
jgi:hypothetical protein